MEAKYFLYAGAVLVVILTIGFSAAAIVNGGANQLNANNAVSNSASQTVFASNNVNSNDVQIVNLKVSGSNYVLEPSILKKGVPVRLVADVANMPGCSKGFKIPEFGVTKSIRAGDNIVEFTPDKTGTFSIACFMNMYTGTFSVSEDGTAKTLSAEDSVAPVVPKASAGSCGAGGGGCGCGMMG